MAHSPFDARDGGIMNYALRMVIPMRREFDQALNVQQFLHDFSYAKEVLELAYTSQNPKLREYAEYLNSRMLGPRHAAPPAASVTQRLTPTTPASASTPIGAKDAEDEVKRLMLEKYRKGLR